MASGDAAWLHMDRKTNRLIVNSVMWFDEPLDWDEVRELLQTRLVDRFPRFAQRVVDTTTAVWWEDDEEFDLDRHLRHAALPAPGGMAELQRYVSGLVGTNLARTDPLWEMHLVDGLEGGGSAIVSRIHHCIADGVALARVMLSLTDDPHEAALARVAEGSAAHQPHQSRLPAVGHLAGAVVREAMHPGRLVTHVRDAAAGTRAIARVVGMTPDAHTSLRGDLGSAKTVLWSEPVPLADLKAAAHAAEVTVNDLLLTSLSGAVRAYLARMDGRAPDVRAVLPVNLRPLDEPLPEELGNEFGLVFLSLPTSIDDPRERMAEVRRRTAALKGSAEPLITFRILDLTGHTPYEAQQLFVDIFAIKASAVVTNVPGPRQPIYLAGRRLRGTIGWPPESGNMGVGVSIISYAGEVIVGLMTDDRLIKDPHRILRDTYEDLTQLAADCLV
jgi:diacylglycerol O-acyltransferase / wax synthase